MSRPGRAGFVRSCLCSGTRLYPNPELVLPECQAIETPLTVSIQSAVSPHQAVDIAITSDQRRLTDFSHHHVQVAREPQLRRRFEPDLIAPPCDVVREHVAHRLPQHPLRPSVAHLAAGR